jgi:hypothetical protein
MSGWKLQTALEMPNGDSTAQSRAKETNKVMSGRPAVIRQRDSKQIINAAKKAGAKSVEFRYGEVTAIIRLAESSDAPIAPDANEWAVDDAHKA